MVYLLASELIDVLVENLLTILVLVALVVVVYLVTSMIVKRSQTGNTVRLAEISIQREKLDMVKRQMEIREMAEASVLLSDDEKARLDAIREDISVLSRKNVALKNELEAKMTRLERGADLAKMQEQVHRIYEQENKLFNLKED
ncbi:MAG: hypothetical protein GQ558_00745 [Thermoplasmata archaeon]|nr:hypothetical protein [Thermoplasmata archaeon]